MEKKLDLRPIFIYLGCTLFISAILLVIFGILNVHEDISQAITQFVALIIPTVAFVLMYKKRLHHDIKKIHLNLLLKVLIFGVVACIINELLTPFVTTENQQILVRMIHTLPILSAIFICLLGPFVEEFVFRYSFDIFIKNEKLFLVISSFVFGLLHTSGFGAGWWLYVLLGFFMGIVYIKSNHNIVASIIVHVLLNIVDFLFIIL